MKALEGEDGKALNVERRSRIVPAHIRQALLPVDYNLSLFAMTGSLLP